jgi:hypothetical protein
MGWAMLDNFDTIEEAQAYLEEVATKGINGNILERERLIIFDDKEFPELGKRFSVNYD